MANHQSPNQESEALWRFGNVIADQIIRTIDGPVVLVYSGMSGIGTATSLMLALEDNKNWKHPIGMLYVRKAQQEPNKPACSWHNIALPNTTYIFVDDHIGGGNTFARCRKGLRETVRDMVYRNGPNRDLPPQPQKFSYLELDHEGKPVVWPPTKADWKPEISYIAVRQHGLEKVEPPAPGCNIDTHRKALFAAEVKKQKWYSEIGGRYGIA